MNEKNDSEIVLDYEKKSDIKNEQKKFEKLKFLKDVIIISDESKDNKKTNSNKNSEIVYFDSKSEKVEILQSNDNLFSSLASSSELESKNLLEKDYKKDCRKEHSVISWKHDLGSLFSKKIRLFYDIEGAKTIQCESFKEWLNIKQFIFVLFEYNIPKIDFFFDFLNMSGLKEEFIDNKYDKIGLETVYFYSLLKKNPSLGYFYFKDLCKKDIHSVNISFCNCRSSGYSIVDLFFEIINFQKEDLIIFKKHLMDYLKNLSEISNKQKISQKEIDISIEEFLERIIDTTDIEILDKNFIFHLIKTISIKFVPEAFHLHCSVDYKNAKPLKEMNFNVSSIKEHETIGFVLKIEKNKNNNFYFVFYEIFQDESKNEEYLKLIDNIAILDLEKKEYLLFNHLVINVIQNKKIFFQKNNLCGAQKI